MKRIMEQFRGLLNFKNEPPRRRNAKINSSSLLTEKEKTSVSIFSKLSLFNRSINFAHC